MRALPVVALIGLVACDRLPSWAGGDRPPPFELFGRRDMRPGVSIERLKDAAEKESRTYRWRCRPLWAQALSCALTVQPGELRAIVDSTGRVIRLTVVAPDSFFVWDDTPLNEPKYRFYVSRLRQRWDSIQPHRFGPTDAGRAEFRWVDAGGRWSGQMWYSPWSRYKIDPREAAELLRQYRDSLTRVPDSIAVADEQAYSTFMALRPPPPRRPPVEQALTVEKREPSPHREAPPLPPPTVATLAPPPSVRQQGSTRPEMEIEQSLAMALVEIARRQRQFQLRYWRYATNSAELRWRTDGEVTIQLVGVTSNGWAAIASHRGVRSRTCVYYQGSVRNAPATFAEHRQAVERSVVCDSF